MKRLDKGNPDCVLGSDVGIRTSFKNTNCNRKMQREFLASWKPRGQEISSRQHNTARRLILSYYQLWDEPEVLNGTEIVVAIVSTCTCTKWDDVLGYSERSIHSSIRFTPDHLVFGDQKKLRKIRKDFKRIYGIFRFQKNYKDYKRSQICHKYFKDYTRNIAKITWKSKIRFNVTGLNSFAWIWCCQWLSFCGLS